MSLYIEYIDVFKLHVGHMLYPALNTRFYVFLDGGWERQPPWGVAGAQWDNIFIITLLLVYPAISMVPIYMTNTVENNWQYD